MSAEIAVVGMACLYPGAHDPRELWENVLARRVQFRRFLDRRLPPEYRSDDPEAPDRTYGRRGAFVDGFRFDPAVHRIPQSTVLATDIVHWIALEVAGRALADAGCADGEGLPRERTAVILGNSLTGEQSRANGLRQRWPYVERAVREGAGASGLGAEATERLVEESRARFLAPFPPTTEDTLAGNMSNTIAGRICGAYDLGGGGYTVDGACASSLLAVCTAATTLREGRADACLAGGVDVSLDPFELVGFAKTRALTPGEMRVYDRRGNGFVPGEGCGFVVLKRLEDALAAGDRIYATLRGWGVSSDGRSAITAPRAQGQARAIRTAWAQGGVPELVEGHGTGTAVGDRVELEALAAAAGEGAPRRIGVTSLKSILGHTKAAAGIGAFLKAVAAVNRRVLPPTAGCEEPHPAFGGPARALYPLLRGEVRDPERPLLAGVSAMGFGGINAHVVLGSAGAPDPRLAPALPERSLLASHQEAELFVIGADDRGALAARLRELGALAADLSVAELADLSAELVRTLPPNPRIRAAVVASTPDGLASQLDRLAQRVEGGEGSALGPESWLGSPVRPPRIGWLCPGQGSQDLEYARTLIARHPRIGALAEALDAVAADAGCPGLLDALCPPADRVVDDAERAAARERLAATELAQPALCLVTLLWAERLRELGLAPAALAGHSLGELSALSLGGALDAPALIRLAVARGRAMAAPGDRPAGMLALTTDRDTAAALCRRTDGYATVANINAEDRVVVAGEATALDRIAEEAARAGIEARRLPVSNAFHSALVAEAGEALRGLVPARPDGLRIPVWSSRTAAPLDPGCDLPDHVAAHVREPVDFVALARALAPTCDLLVEVGAGRVLSGLTSAITGGQPPCLPVEGRPGRGGDLLRVLASAWVRGAEVRWAHLHDDRLIRPFVPAGERSFLVNPCERGREGRAPIEIAPPPRSATAAPPEARSADDILTRLLDLVAERTGYDRATLSADQRLRDELNLDSIKAGEIVASAARAAGVADRIEPAQLAAHPLSAIAAALGEAAGASALAEQPHGAAPEPGARWVRTFGLRTAPAPRTAAVPWTGRRVRPVGDNALGPILARAGATLDAIAPDTLVVALPPDRTPRAQVAAIRNAVDALVPSVRAVLWIQRTGGALGTDPDPGSGTALAAFARSLWLERPHLAVRVLDLSDDTALDVVAAELPADPGFDAFGLGPSGRCTLAAHPLPPQARPRAPLSAGEVALVTGGAKGITAACALALAQATGIRLALVGSTPRESADDEIVHTLGRAALAGVSARYFSADLTDRAAVSALVARVREEMGPIAAVIHGAGRNVPRRVETVSAAEAEAEIAPKLLGALHLLDALDDAPPRQLIALTSIIGVTGMHGNAWYAFANENLDLAIARFARKHPGTAPLCVAYGVWDEIGMGARMGSARALARAGIGALSPAQGTERFVALALGDLPVRQPVVTAHLDGLPTWPSPPAADPAHRLLGSERSGAAGVECRATLILHPDRHPWLRDHAFSGSLLLPAVMGLEAMAQAASSARGGGTVHRVETIALPTPIVAAGEGTRIRISALVREHDPDTVDAEIRTEQTGFGRAHFSATFRFGPSEPGEVAPLPALPPPAVPLVPRDDLYGGLLFQGPAFRRMGPVSGISPGAVRFSGEVRPPDDGERFVLGDPFLRDALLQAGQLLVPQDDALPVHIDRITLADPHAAGPREILATLDRSTPDRHTGTVLAVDAEGRLRERIDGYTLAILGRHPDRPDPAELADPSLAEPRVAALVEASLRERGLPAPRLALALAPLHALPPEARREAVRPMIAPLAPDSRLDWTPSGQPVLSGGHGVSISHDPQFCVAVTGPEGIGCDLEPVRPRDWTTLLGSQRALLAAIGGDPDTAGTRVWTASEALFKAGARSPTLTPQPATGPVLAFDASEGTRRWRVLTWAVRLPRGPERIFALAQPAPGAPTALPPDLMRVRMLQGEPDRMETRFVVSFDEASAVDGSVPAHALAGWMGRLRELALIPLRDPLREALASGRYGMVTQSADVNLAGQARALDRIEATTWVEELRPRTCLLGFRFHRLDDRGEPELVGEASQRFAWVEIEGRGEVRGAEFPAFLSAFLASLRCDAPRPAAPPLAPPRGPILHTTSIQTSLLESNAVGNVYYAHYFRWPQRLLDRWLWEAHPALLDGAGARGQLRTTSTRIEFLRESMPFDTIDASLHLERQEGRQIELGVRFTRPDPRGGTLQLAIGRMTAELVPGRHGLATDLAPADEVRRTPADLEGGLR